LPVSVLRLQDKVRIPTRLGTPGHGLVILAVPKKQKEFIEQYGLKKLEQQTSFKIYV
jgi:hypothetical protein